MFTNNGSGVRGDMKAVVKAILLDPEARDPAEMSDPTFGKLREPFLKRREFRARVQRAAQSGFYALDNFFMDHFEEPMKSPSVFNFYLPGYTPPGTLHAAGLVAPEFQIVNAGSAISCPNYYLNATVNNDLHRWGSGNPTTRETESHAGNDAGHGCRRADPATRSRADVRHAVRRANFRSSGTP